MQRQLAELDSRAQALHRHRLARAAHADLLARRLPRAARGRGARRGDARAVHRASSASRSTALGKLATDLLDLSRLEAGSLELRPERDRHRASSPDGRRRVRAGARGPRVPPRAAARRGAASRPSAILSAWPRSCASSSTTRCSHTPDRHRRRGLGRRAATARVRLAVTDFGTGHQARRARARLRALLHLRRRPGLGPRPGDRARAGRAHGRATSAPTSVPGRTTFSLELPP